MSTVAKSLSNEVQCCVEDCLEGFVAINSGIEILDGHRVVIRQDIDEVKQRGQVALLSGGGSGHEPAHAGFVGSGMLSGAIAGSVFTSPPPSSILAAIRKVGLSNPGGVLLIIKNYTGDRLNFGLAAERAKAQGIPVEMVVVGEDCALTSADKTAGRRGLCGTVFIHKLAGALAQEGKKLEDIAQFCRTAASNMGTIGLSLLPCSLPGSGPSFTLGNDEMELGLGIHGEAGIRRMKVLSAKEAVDTMLRHMTLESSVTRLPLKSGDHVAVIINNLGGTSVLEMNIVAKEAIHWFENQGMVVDRAYCGSFMTSLQMAGVSITAMLVDERTKELLDAPVSAPGWQRAYLKSGDKDRVTPKHMACDDVGALHESSSGAQVSAETAAMLEKAVSFACEALGNCHRHLNEFDTQAGDADCGSTFKRGTDAVLAKLKSGGLPVNCPHNLLLALASVAEQDMGGSSGALYSLFLSAACQTLIKDTSVQAWAQALQEGNAAISRYGGAEPGDRTMLDALHAAQVELTKQLSANTDPLAAFGHAVSEANEIAIATTSTNAHVGRPSFVGVEHLTNPTLAAEKAAMATASMKARAGRASYVSAEHLTNPDPGAHAVGIWMRAVYEACKTMQ